MKLLKKVLTGLLLFLPIFVGVFHFASAWTPTAVIDDPLVRMPGTQPHDGISLESPNRCMNCHSDYDSAAEPGSNWQGSMMAQSARDFLFLAAMTVAAQDAIWATGSPNATDICLRCHFPEGWLEGRSDPTNASLMIGSDFDGIHCDFCHRMYDPFFESTYTGAREGNDWLNYWDETNVSDTPSHPAALETYGVDQLLSGVIKFFNGENYYTTTVSGTLPVSSNYIEATSGQYFISSDPAKRGPFADAEGRHQMLYSRFHKSKYFCATCHDVSNPVLANLGEDGTQPLKTETDFAGSYYHVERTFSEFMSSAYGQQGGAPGIGPYGPDNFSTSLPNNYISKCQDCHMTDVVGTGADLNNAVVRPTESTEHPNSGQPLHDLTGGNVWVSAVLASAIPGSPNFDSTNSSLLNQGVSVLTLDLSAGLGINPAALLAGSARAAVQLQNAAEIKDLAYKPETGLLSFKVQNQTGHKLISGFPEGRRMFVNIQAYAGNQLIWEVNPYDTSFGTLRGLPSRTDLPLLANQVYVDELVYEMHPSSTLTGETETLHFVLADDRYKDNRIPPMGYDLVEAGKRISVPRWHGEDAPGYFTGEEYAGGFDAVSLTIPQNATYVVVNLYYQTTSREYIEFLRDEINAPITGTKTLPDTAYIIQTDPFFNQLKAWGDTIWQLWDHNKNLPGAAPFLMTSNSYTSPGQFNKNAPANGASSTPTNPTLVWNPSLGATEYEYCIDTSNNNTCDSSWISNGPNTSVGLTGLSEGTTFYWQVRAEIEEVKIYANGSEAAYWYFTTITSPPGAFSKTAPIDGATGLVTAPTLSWEISNGATKYEYCIDAANNNTCDTNWISTGTSTSVGLTGLTEGTTYYWQVRSSNGGGFTYANTGYWSLTTLTSPPGSFSKNAPADTATGVSTTPALSWGTSTGTTEYEYCIDNTDNNTCNTNWISTGTSKSVGLTGLSEGTTYYWQVRAINAGGINYADGGETAFWSFTTSVGAPGTFSKTAPTDGATGVSTAPTLIWEISNGAEYYEYCFDTSDDNVCSNWISTGTSTSVGLIGLAEGTTYYWQVRAINAGGTTYANPGYWSFTTILSEVFSIFLPVINK